MQLLRRCGSQAARLFSSSSYSWTAKQVAFPERQVRWKVSRTQEPHHIFIWDIETTGLNCNRDQMVEIGCLHPASGASFSRLVQPTAASMTKEAQEVHGISPQSLASAPVFAEVWEEFRVWVDGHGEGKKLLLSHFGHSLDVPVLTAELGRLSKTVPEDWVLADAATAIRSRVKKGSRLSLDALTASLDISCGTKHRAADDAVRCWKVLESLYPDTTLTTLSSIYVLSQKKKKRVKQEEEGGVKKKSNNNWWKWKKRKQPAVEAGDVARFTKCGSA